MRRVGSRFRSPHKKTSESSFSDDEYNFEEYLTFYRKLLLPNEKNNASAVMVKIHKFLSFNEKIFSSSSVAETFLYFCLHGAATAWILQSELNMPEATAYRALKRLRALKIVLPAIKVSKIRNSKGGPRPIVWALTDASTEEISKALMLHFRTLSPKYRVAEEVAQTILDEYVNRRHVEEISYREILIRIKEMHIPFRTPDIAYLASQYLHERGVKVWR